MLFKGQAHYVMSCLFVFVCKFLFWCCFILLCFGVVDFGCDVDDDGFVFLGFLNFFSFFFLFHNLVLLFFLCFVVFFLHFFVFVDTSYDLQVVQGIFFRGLIILSFFCGLQ
jgi:hypothetical protein